MNRLRQDTIENEVPKLLRADPAEIDGATLGTLVNVARVLHDVDGHTFFSPNSQAKLPSLSRFLDPLPLPKAHLYGGIAMLSMPFCPQSNASAYQEAGIAAVAACRREDPRAWVLDLRLNSGGTMWPMLEVMAPLLGTLTPGSFEDPRPHSPHPVLPWTVKGDYIPVAPTMPVAVWTSPMTGSSGEISSIMFRGRPCTRFFGDKTSGAPTSNESHPIGDLGTLHLTTMLCRDRLGRRYFGEILPDERCAVPVRADPRECLGDQYQAALMANTQELLGLTEEWLRTGFAASNA